MPWKASSVMEERLRFVARLLDGEAMTEVCREFVLVPANRLVPMTEEDSKPLLAIGWTPNNLENATK